MIEHEIPAGVRPMAAEKYVRRAWPMLPGRAVRQLFERRDVKRGGARLGAGDAVAGGDVLRLYLPDALTDFSIETVFDDGRLLAAVKPQGLPVDADQDGVGADTLRTRLTRIHPTARLCHRLDVATGGLVLAAMDDETEAQALQTFRDHALQKTYYALAKGGFDRPEGILRAYLIRSRRNRWCGSSIRPAPGQSPSRRATAWRTSAAESPGWSWSRSRGAPISCAPTWKTSAIRCWATTNTATGS